MLAEIGDITIDDVDEISQVFEQEFLQIRQTADSILNSVIANITQVTSVDGIYDSFANEPMIAQRLEHDESVQKMLKELASRISETDRSPDQVRELSLQIFNVDKSFDNQRSKVLGLRKHVEDSIKLKESRNKLGLEK